MGQLLKEEGLIPEFIVTSSAKRAWRTAECAALHSGYRGETRVTSELYEAPAARIVQVIKATAEPVRRLLVVGHNPWFEEFLEPLIGIYTPLSAGALACIDLNIDQWNQLNDSTRGQLIRVWQPRELP